VIEISKHKPYNCVLLRSTKNAFVMQSKSTFLEFLDVNSVCIHRRQFGPRKIIQGLWPRFHFIGLALTHIPTWKQKTLPSCRLIEVRSIAKFQHLFQWRKPAHRRKRKRSPNAEWTEIVWKDRPVLYDSKCKHAQSRPVLPGCEMTRFCYITRPIVHYVHDGDFETPWLLYVKSEQLHFFRRILNISD